MRELNKDMSYENALVFGNILKLSTSSKSDTVQKISQQGKKFELLNQGPKRMLEFLKLDEAFYATLAKPIKPCSLRQPPQNILG